MVNIPRTSTSLLSAITASRESPRWYDFYGRYQPMLSAFISRRYPQLDVDDVIQDTIIAFMDQLPNYKYDPVLKGHFHNYLLGIAKFKALDAMRRRARESEKRDRYKEELAVRRDLEDDNDVPENEIRDSIAKLAIRKFLDDSKINMQVREVFRRVELKQESVALVAEAFGITRNYVYQIKLRAKKLIGDIVGSMQNVAAC